MRLPPDGCQLTRQPELLASHPIPRIVFLSLGSCLPPFQEPDFLITFSHTDTMASVHRANIVNVGLLPVSSFCPSLIFRRLFWGRRDYQPCPIIPAGGVNRHRGHLYQTCRPSVELSTMTGIADLHLAAAAMRFSFSERGRPWSRRSTSNCCDATAVSACSYPLTSSTEYPPDFNTIVRLSISEPS